MSYKTTKYVRRKLDPEKEAQYLFPWDEYEYSEKINGVHKQSRTKKDSIRGKRIIESEKKQKIIGIKLAVCEYGTRLSWEGKAQCVSEILNQKVTVDSLRKTFKLHKGKDIKEYLRIYKFANVKYDDYMYITLNEITNVIETIEDSLGMKHKTIDDIADVIYIAERCSKLKWSIRAKILEEYIGYTISPEAMRKCYARAKKNLSSDSTLMRKLEVHADYMNYRANNRQDWVSTSRIIQKYKIK